MLPDPGDGGPELGCITVACPRVQLASIRTHQPVRGRSSRSQANPQNCSVAVFPRHRFLEDSPLCRATSTCTPRSAHPGHVSHPDHLLAEWPALVRPQHRLATVSLSLPPPAPFTPRTSAYSGAPLLNSPSIARRRNLPSLYTAVLPGTRMQRRG